MTKWISVKTQLPEDRQRVLAFNGKIYFAYFNEKPGEGITSLWETNDSPTPWGLQDVTHWAEVNPPEN